MGRLEFTKQAESGWKKQFPSADLTVLGTVQRLVWSGRLTEEILQRTAKMSGFRRRSDYEVIALLRRVEPDRLTPNEVAAQLLSSPSGMTGKLDRLEAQSLIKRVPDPVDRRAVRLALTDSGRELVDKAFITSLEVYESLLATLSTQQREDFDQLLETVLSSLDSVVGERNPL